MKSKNKKIVAVTASTIALTLIGYASLSSYKNTDEINDNSTQLELVNNKIKDELVSKENIKETNLLEIKKSSNNDEQIIKELPVYSSINSENNYKTISNILKGISKVKNPKKIYDIDKVMKRKWVVDIGNMSYRSNFELVDGHIYVGSNGEYFNDWHTWDKKSGVYKINAKSGKLVKKFANGKMGDMDVNGLLYYKDYLFFGNDNDEFLCTDLNGEIIWRIPVSGDVEHRPTLVKRKDDDVIVFATEVGEVRAVNPENGNTVWEYYHPEFNGWKKGDNRYVFKLTTHFKRGYIFFDQPIRNDYNGDGVMDLHWNGTVLSGQNGKLIKSLPKKIKALNNDLNIIENQYPIKVGSGRNAKFVLIDNASPTIDSMTGSWIPGCYKGDKKIMVFKQDGSLLSDFIITKPSHLKSPFWWNISLFKINNNEVAFSTSEAIYIYDIINNSLSEINNFNKKTTKKSDYSEYYYVNYDLAGIVKFLPNYLNTEIGLCRAVKWEFGKKWGSNSVIKFFNVKNNNEVLSLRLPSNTKRSSFSGIEGPFIIRDVDNDGKQELLLECDEKLMCYDFSSIKL